MRPSKNQTYMDVAVAVSQRSHDSETKVGAVLVSNDTGSIIATGQNGFVRGAPDDKLPTTRPDKYPYMVHAEQNLVAQCALRGIAMRDCTLVCTHSPCISCMRLLWQCGITRVIIKTKYKDFDSLLKMEDIKIEHVDTEEHFTELRYIIRC
jgi:dCMP deaminase